MIIGRRCCVRLAAPRTADDPVGLVHDGDSGRPRPAARPTGTGREPGPEWLRPPLRAVVRTRQAVESADRPLRWDRSVRSVLRPRAVALVRSPGAGSPPTTIARSWSLSASRCHRRAGRHGGSWGCLGVALRSACWPASCCGRVANRARQGQVQPFPVRPGDPGVRGRLDATGVDLQVIDPVGVSPSVACRRGAPGSALLPYPAGVAGAHGGPDEKGAAAASARL